MGTLGSRLDGLGGCWRRVGGLMKGESNERDDLIRGAHWGWQEKCGSKETPRNPQG